MLESGRNWELFGYDMRHLGRHFTAAWRDLLWGFDSPVRRRLDEVVMLERSGEAPRPYHVGRPCSASGGSVCRAVLLPPDLALTRQLTFPVAAEAELAGALALEVRASSPFPAADTAWGWAVTDRDDSRLQVSLGIVSIGATMAYLGREFDLHDPQSREVWVEAPGAMVVVHGFGEQLRAGRYRRRLVRCAGMLGAAALLLPAILGLSALFKGMEAQRLEGLAATAAREAAEPLRSRELLATANETIAAVNELVRQHPAPQVELARLTGLLGDDVSVYSFVMRGDEIALKGRAVDAAAVMKQLTEVPAYGEVTAPQGIAKLGDSGLEQFQLDIRLAAGSPGP